ncbi:MAG: UDP-N-acetylmuramoyl-L-alanine--D-glutamate ligase [Deltaproteobacteria bacterium]|nr:UDP-N-acetylmuramoyl-L-alanine--D-glutamate ligase [Deltaproteobacteria bacterium]
MLELKDKKCIVIGGGKSGISAARFLRTKGSEVTLNDVASLERLKGLEGEGITLEGGGHRASLFEGAELIVLSPGVPANLEPLCSILAGAEERGAQIISEVELASRFISAPIIAVAGTNGKSTTTAFIGELLANGGKKVFVGGNIGIPLTDYLLEGDKADYIVLEVSSFQLERISTFRPFISILLNITADHLDRYASMAEYIEAKKRLFMNQGHSDYAIVNAGDKIAASLLPAIKAEILPLGQFADNGGGAAISGDKIVAGAGNERQEVSLAEVKKSVIQHIENLLAALGVAFICRIPEAVFIDTLKSFKGLPHRMEPAGRVGGISFYDDSKATNVGAVVKTLESMEGKIILIAGGKDKGGSYDPLKAVIKEKVKTLVLIGEAALKMEEVLGGEVETMRADSMEDALEKAWGRAVSGDAVILSPACSSFDMFSDYAERGRVFKKAAARLCEREAGKEKSREEAPLAG